MYNAPKPMNRKALPDLLTLSRGAVGMAILGLIPAGSAALTSVLWLLLLGWTTDLVDGRLARRLETAPTWVGEHEFHFDMLMVLSSAVYLVATGLVHRGVGLVYLLVAVSLSVLSYTRTGEFLKFKSLTMLLAVPWVFGPYVLAYLRGETLVAYAGVLWILFALLADWRRFGGVVGEFLQGARAFIRRT